MPTLFDIKTADNKIRSRIGTDGSVTNPHGKIVAYLNPDGSTGDAEETLLGRYGQSGAVYTAFSQVIGKIDETGTKVLDGDGSVLMSVSAEGELRDGSERKVGVVSPYRTKFFRLISSYFFFVDPALVLAGHFSLIHGVKGKGFDTESTTQNLLVFHDKYQNVRGRVTTDGEVYGVGNKLLGYLNEDGSAGDVNEVFLGEINHGGQVVNGSGAAVGQWRKEGMIIQYGQDVAGSIQSSGDLQDAQHIVVGNIQMLDARKVLIAAGFLFFFDTTLLSLNVEEKKTVELKKRDPTPVKQEEPVIKQEPVKQVTVAAAPVKAIESEEDEFARMEREFEEERRRQEAAILADLEDLPGEGGGSGSANGRVGSGGKGWVVTKPKSPDYDEEELEGVEVWVALYDYDHFDANAKEFLSFQEGDTFQVLPSNNDLQGWKIAINAQGQKGFVPGNYLQLQSELSD